jgi:hypothetical protein
VALCAAGLTLSCDIGGAIDPAIDDGTQSQSGQALSLGGNALLVVGNATLSASDSALRQRLQGLGLVVTVKTGSAATAADAVNRLVVISESVLSADVNTKFTGTNSPVVSLEPLLFDELGMTGTTSADNGSLAGQSSVLMLATPGTLAGNVTVAVTGSPQAFGFGRPAASATVLATLAGDPTHATIFSYERGASMFLLVAPGRRVGWFASAATVGALNSNGWNLFDAAITWAFAGLSQRTCMADLECPGTLCLAGRCSNTCVLGKTPGSSGCVDIACQADSACPGTLCQGGQCTSTCVVGKIRVGNTCSSITCMTDAECPGTVCVSNTCSRVCGAGRVLCGSACPDPLVDHANCGGCGHACASNQTCNMGVCQ